MNWTKICVRFARTAAACGLVGLMGANAVAQGNLIAFYEGDKANGPDGSVVLDSSGNGNHGLFIGSAGLVENGVNGGALNFNADRSSIVVNTAEQGNFDGIADNQEFTIGFWMAGGDSNPRNSSVFWAEGVEGETNRAIQSHATWSNGQVYLDIGGCCNAQDQRLNGVLEPEFIRASEGDEWTHLAYSLDEEGDALFYVNGEIYENADGQFFERFGPTATIPSIQRFYIASDNGLGNQWEGRMDDFFVSDKALSEDDVLKIYNDGVRSVFTGLAAEPEDYTPGGDVGLRLENIDGQLGGAVYAPGGNGDIVGWRVEEVFTTQAGGQTLTTALDLAAAGVSGSEAAGTANTSVLFGDVPLVNEGADDVTRTFRLIADVTGGDDPVIGADFSRSLLAEITLPGSGGGGGGIPDLVLKGDIDQSGDVGFGDFLILSSNFGLQGAATQGVPEPATASMLGIACLALLQARRRRNG